MEARRKLGNSSHGVVGVTACVNYIQRLYCTTDHAILDTSKHLRQSILVIVLTFIYVTNCIEISYFGVKLDLDLFLLSSCQTDNFLVITS